MRSVVFASVLVLRSFHESVILQLPDFSRPFRVLFSSISEYAGLTPSATLISPLVDLPLDASSWNSVPMLFPRLLRYVFSQMTTAALVVAWKVAFDTHIFSIFRSPFSELPRTLHWRKGIWFRRIQLPPCHSVGSLFVEQNTRYCSHFATSSIFSLALQWLHVPRR